MRCEHHPGVEASAECDICEIPICGVCSNYTATAVLCDRCVNSVAMSDLFAAREKSRANDRAGTRASTMSKLLEEGKSLNLETSASAPKKKTRSKIWDTLHVSGIFGCFVIIGVQVYTNYGGASALTTDEIATEELARERIELCVQVFWEIAAELKSGDIPDDTLRCEVPGSPNIILRDGNNIIVRHPNPQLLGYSDISVTRNNPVPVLVR